MFYYLTQLSLLFANIRQHNICDALYMDGRALISVWINQNPNYSVKLLDNNFVGTDRNCTLFSESSMTLQYKLHSRSHSRADGNAGGKSLKIHTNHLTPPIHVLRANRHARSHLKECTNSKLRFFSRMNFLVCFNGYQRIWPLVIVYHYNFHDTCTHGTPHTCVHNYIK